MARITAMRLTATSMVEHHLQASKAATEVAISTANASEAGTETEQTTAQIHAPGLRAPPGACDPGVSHPRNLQTQVGTVAKGGQSQEVLGLSPLSLQHRARTLSLPPHRMDLLNIRPSPAHCPIEVKHAVGSRRLDQRALRATGKLPAMSAQSVLKRAQEGHLVQASPLLQNQNQQRYLKPKTLENLQAPRRSLCSNA